MDLAAIFIIVGCYLMFGSTCFILKQVSWGFLKFFLAVIFWPFVIFWKILRILLIAIDFVRWGIPKIFFGALLGVVKAMSYFIHHKNTLSKEVL